MAKRRGLVLSNIGTPASPEPKDVRVFLREFLSDPRVLDMSPMGRWLLLNLIILPFRPKKSAKAYQEIWTDEGSPILVNSREMAKKMAGVLGEGWVVGLGMRYGDPSMSAALDGMLKAGVEEVVLLPLFPQYALSSTASSIDYFEKLMAEKAPDVPTQIITDFFEHPAFCEPSAKLAQEHLDDSVDHVLFSFHGLPVHQVVATDPTGAHCQKSENCCDAICEANRLCYRAQSHVTARRLASHLGLEDSQWSIAFQSRLTKVPWIEPHTDKLLVELAEQGVKHLAVMCPSFVADCLETLEEIDMRAREDFLEAGGERFSFVPCLNARTDWVEALAKMVTEG